MLVCFNSVLSINPRATAHTQHSNLTNSGTGTSFSASFHCASSMSRSRFAALVFQAGTCTKRLYLIDEVSHTFTYNYIGRDRNATSSVLLKPAQLFDTDWM